MVEEIQGIRDLLKSLIISSLICFWLYWLYSRRNLYRFAMKFPGCFGLPIIGCFTAIKDLRFVLQGSSVLFERCKSDTICIWMGLKPVVLTYDPEFIGKILSSSDLLNKAKTFYTPIYEGLEGGLLSSPASTWQHSRKMINPSFSHKVLLSFIPVFHKGKEFLLSKFDEMAGNGEYFLFDIIQRTSLGISVETTMGKVMEPGDEIEKETTANLRMIMENSTIHMMLKCVNLGSLMVFHIRFQKAKRFVKNFVYKLIHDKLIRMKNSTEKSITNAENLEESIKKAPKIFIDQAIEIYQKQKFSFNDIIAESNNIVLASSDTTANGLYSAILMLALHPDVQERLFSEIVNVFPEKDFEMEYQHLEQFPYLDMVLNETLRLAPSVPLIGRHVMKDLHLTKDLMLPKDLQVSVSIYHLHRRKDIWS
ncbi:hypothetical protein DOY81_010332 [Sarcophaga bullata]|nr:hypothetical protein DOY81_010332 [Sarcophaga bullata]